MINKFTQSVSIILVFLSLILCSHAINQKCTKSNNQLTNNNIQSNQSQCPPNSKCSDQGFCVCDKGYFGNCQNQGQTIDGSSKQFNITQTTSYFLIQPIIDQFVTFQFILCNQNSINNIEILNLWADQGNLTTPTSQNALGNDKQLRVQQGCMALVTSYFTFNLQPNGQKQMLILGLRLKNPGTLKIQLLVQQISIFGFDVIYKIVLILISGICLISLGGVVYCIYKCRRRGRHVLHEQKLDIGFFDEYMPVKMVNVKQIKQEICSVCLGEFKQNQEIRQTVCSHYFHKSCLDEWCVTNLSCPICRTSFEKANLIHHQYLLSIKQSNSTQDNDTIIKNSLNGQTNLRQPIV